MDHYYKMMIYIVAFLYITRAFGSGFGDINRKHPIDRAHEGIFAQHEPANNKDELMWQDDLENQFQVAHFGVMGRCNLQLCHKVSRQSIQCILNKIIERAPMTELQPNKGKSNRDKYVDDCEQFTYPEICRFLTKLAKFDQQAYVNYGSWYPPLKNWASTGVEWWRQYQGAKKFYTNTNGQLDPNSYITKWLEDKNQEYLNTALICLTKPLDANCVSTILNMAYNFPANLRYGDSSENMGIGKFFDPLGDVVGKITEDETLLILEFGGDKYQCIDYHLEQYNGNYQIKSSSGRPETERGFKDYGKFKYRWYIWCPVNGPHCVY